MLSTFHRELWTPNSWLGGGRGAVDYISQLTLFFQTEQPVLSAASLCTPTVVLASFFLFTFFSSVHEENVFFLVTSLCADHEVTQMNFHVYGSVSVIFSAKREAEIILVLLNLGEQDPSRRPLAAFLQITFLKKNVTKFSTAPLEKILLFVPLSSDVRNFSLMSLWVVGTNNGRSPGIISLLPRPASSSPSSNLIRLISMAARSQRTAQPFTSQLSSFASDACIGGKKKIFIFWEFIA